MSKASDQILALSTRVEHKLSCGVTVYIKKLTLDEAEQLQAVSRGLGVEGSESEAVQLEFAKQAVPMFVVEADGNPAFTPDEVGKMPLTILKEIFEAFSKVNDLSEEASAKN